MRKIKIDFENITEKCEEIINSSTYAELVKKISFAKKIYLFGNGGLHYVSSHMATDMTRLIPDKVVFSYDSVGFITSSANDYGFNELYVRWLETTAIWDDPKDSLVIGMSCSGNSVNVIKALHWADKKSFETFFISGQKSQILNNNITELTFSCEYFHTVEVLCMMIFYDMIHQTDNKCPSIRGEKNRMKDSELRAIK
jgi:D-sedoheptulose 7-phosphate isomerase